MYDIRELENRMWQAAKSGDRAAFSELVLSEAVMVCGGCRCTGAEYTEIISGQIISDYEILQFETVLETEDVIQVHYVIRTTADSPENSDMAGLFHVTSTWKRQSGGWKLFFNMDQRIFV